MTRQAIKRNAVPTNINICAETQKFHPAVVVKGRDKRPASKKSRRKTYTPVRRASSGQLRKVESIITETCKDFLTEHKLQIGNKNTQEILDSRILENVLKTQLTKLFPDKDKETISDSIGEKIPHSVQDEFFLNYTLAGGTLWLIEKLNGNMKLLTYAITKTKSRLEKLKHFG